MTTILFLAITFGWSVSIGILLKLLGIPVNSTLGPLLLAVFLMPSPAIATCVVHRFRWSQIVENYGLNLKRLDLFLIVRSTIVFSVSFGLFYLVLVYLLGNALHLSGVGTLTLSPVEVKAELVRAVGASRAASANLPPVPLLYVLSFVAPIIAGFTINGLCAFGEELGSGATDSPAKYSSELLGGCGMCRSSFWASIFRVIPISGFCSWYC
jgi:hypothetical protein